MIHFNDHYFDGLEYQKGWTSEEAVSFSLCSHTGAMEVYKIGKGKVVLGSRLQMEDYVFSGFKVDLLLNCCKLEISTPISYNAAARNIITAYPGLRYKEIPTITLEWDDGTAPPVGRPFWRDLAKYVQKGNTLGIYCMGGHGRTGTAAVALVLAAGQKGDILKELREIYCREAVETYTQLKYLRALGLETYEIPSIANRPKVEKERKEVTNGK